MIAGYVQLAPTSAISGTNTQITLPITMLNGQAVSDSHTGFGPGMRILVAGLSSGTGGSSDPCNGYQVVNGGVTATTISYTVPGSFTCVLEGKTDGSQTCNGLPAASGAPGYGCVAAGLPPALGKVIVEQQNSDGQLNGYYCYVGTSAGCHRSNFVGPAGPQPGAHSVGIAIY